MSNVDKHKLQDFLVSAIGGEGFLDHRAIAEQIMRRFNVTEKSNVGNKVLPIEGQVLRWADLGADYETPSPTRVVTEAEHANIVNSDMTVEWDNKTSRRTPHGYGPNHKLILDIDYPVYVVESSPGRSHLYIDAAMSWSTLVSIMAVFVEAKLLEPGYMYASIERGYTSVRVPWALKNSGVHIEEPPEPKEQGSA